MLFRSWLSLRGENKSNQGKNSRSRVDNQKNCDFSANSFCVWHRVWCLESDLGYFGGRQPSHHCTNLVLLNDMYSNVSGMTDFIVQLNGNTDLGASHPFQPAFSDNYIVGANIAIPSQRWQKRVMRMTNYLF